MQGKRNSGGYYFSVSPKKFIVMCLCTFNLYLLYWFYRNWMRYREHSGQKIRAVWRAVFSVLWAYSLFKIIQKTAQEYKIKSRGLWPAPLAIIYVLLNVLTPHSDALAFASFFSLFLIFPFNLAAIRINRAISHGYIPESTYSGKEMTIVVTGGILLTLSIIGVFMDTK